MLKQQKESIAFVIANNSQLYLSIHMRYSIAQQQGVKFSYEGDINNAISPMSDFVRILPSILCTLTDEAIELFNGYEIILEDKNDYYVRCVPEEKTILISSITLELLWLSTYTNISIFTKAQQTEEHRNISSNEHFIVFPASAFIAINRFGDLCHYNLPPWPENLPMPKCEYDVRDGQIENLASEIVLYAMGFIILHELSHSLMHQIGHVETCIENEIRADEFAISNYMDESWFNNYLTGSRANAFQKKMMAMIETTAMFILADQLRNRNRETHPSGIKRLRAVLRNNGTLMECDNPDDYNPTDSDFDLRPAIVYAAYVLFFYAQNIFEPQNNHLQEMRDTLLYREYETPLELYNKLEQLFIEADRHRNRTSSST